MDVLLNILEQLNINSSIFNQLAIVFSFYVIAKFTLFKKLQEVIELRIEKTKKTEDSANNLLEKFEELKEEYETKVESTYKEVQEEKTDKKKQIDKELAQVFRRKEEEVNEYISNAKKEIESNAEEQKGAVLGKADEFASELINKIKV